MPGSGADLEALRGTTLVEGSGRGPAVVLDVALSFWGGVDPETGRVMDARHPQAGAVLSGSVLVMPTGRGSSSSSSVLAEAIRAGTAPAAIVLGEADPILALGAIVARELYGRTIPVVVAGDATILPGEDVEVLAGSDGAEIRVRS